MTEFYGCLHLTEGEHWCVEDDIRECCELLGMKLVYYRKLIHPKSKVEVHVPMYREFKVEGTPAQMGQFQAWVERKKLEKYMERNPHTVARKERAHG